MDKKAYIVIAEDDFSYADVLKRKLENEGMEVVIARDGEEAMKILRERKPDLLLLDLIMPNKTVFRSWKR